MTERADDSDETEGRALYRARADRLAQAQVAMAKRRVKRDTDGCACRDLSCVSED